MSKAIKIAFVDCPYLLRAGMTQALRNNNQLSCHILEFNETINLKDSLQLHNPDIIVVNPHNAFGLRLSDIKYYCSNNPKSRLTAVCYAFMEQQTSELFHAVFYIDDTAEKIIYKIGQQLNRPDDTEEATQENQDLTLREKEIIVGVVKGQTNKEIADSLCISAHTVISHRRNIAKKLQIHSPSGLTIYAILNKLVDINEIKL